MAGNNITKKKRKYYTAGPENRLFLFKTIIDQRKMSAIDFFHFTDVYLDWDTARDNLAVLEPLITLPAKWGDEIIFVFS